MIPALSHHVTLVLAMAREEAIQLQHDYVGTEHILLGLIREGEGIAAAVLNKLNVNRGHVQAKIEESAGRGDTTRAMGELRYTPRAKKLLEFAMAEAHRLNHGYVGTEHLLLGMRRMKKGTAARVLRQLEITLPASVGEMHALYGTQHERVPQATASSRESPSRRTTRPRPSVFVGLPEGAPPWMYLVRDCFALVALGGALNVFPATVSDFAEILGWEDRVAASRPESHPNVDQEGEVNSDAAPNQGS